MSADILPSDGPQRGVGPGSDRRVRLLVVVPFAPRHDNHHGGRVLAQLLDNLVEEHEVGVVHLDRAGEASMDPGLVARCAFVRSVPVHNGRLLGTRWRYRLNVLQGPLIGRPTAVSALHSRRLGRLARSTVDTWRPDVVQVEGDVLAYCVNQLEGSSSKTLLVIHDPGLPSADELGHATNGRQHIAHRLDTATWRRYWRRWLPRFDAVVNLTRTDAEAVTRAVPGVTPLDIPLGIDIPDQALCALGSGPPGVAFVGGYTHPPNIDAAIRLMTSIMPQARARAPELALTIVGDSPSAEMREAAGKYDEITGRVPTVAPYLDRASLVVLPIRLGGGMRVKLLEALAAGKAVVASPVAAAGLRVENRRVLRIADSDEEFSAAITELLGDDAARAELGHNARAWALENLSWSSRRAQYEQLYLNLLDRTSARTESETLR